MPRCLPVTADGGGALVWLLQVTGESVEDNAILVLDEGTLAEWMARDECVVVSRTP